MLKMALNRHKLARYRKQRKRRLLIQVALIIAFCASLSPIIRAERDISKTNLFRLQPSNCACMSSEDHNSINFNVSFLVHVAILSNHVRIQNHANRADTPVS